MSDDADATAVCMICGAAEHLIEDDLGVIRCRYATACIERYRKHRIALRRLDEVTRMETRQSGLRSAAGVDNLAEG